MTRLPAAPRDEPELSAIVLCYRGEERILGLLDELHSKLSGSAVPFEMVLVANYDRGRQDRTPDVARQFAAEHDGVKVIAQIKDGAMGWDMRSGLAAARGRYLAVIDGDGQNPPSDILRMYHAMVDTGAAVMKGRRVAREDSISRKLLSFTYNLLFRVLFGTRGLWDINGKPKALSREAYQRLELTSDDWFVDAEIVLEAKRLGLPIRELEVTYLENTRESFVRPGAVAEFLRNMIRYRFGAR